MLRLARLYSSLELPGWGQVLKRCGGSDANRWKRGSIVRIRGKWDGCLHDLDLSNWSERHTYFLGRYYDLATQLLLKAVLRPGDRFVDIGANIGMISMLASRLVGPSGTIDAFEPNPGPASRIEASAARNSISTIRLHRVALGEHPGTAQLTVVSEHTGCGTLAKIPDKDAALVSATHEVPVVTGDSVLGTDPSRIALIKMDVEGYECHALRGLGATLRAMRPPLACEVAETHLQRAGSSSAELFRMMSDHGYKAYWIGTARRMLSYRLDLIPITAASHAKWNNAFFVHPENVPAGVRGMVS